MVILYRIKEGNAYNITHNLKKPLLKPSSAFCCEDMIDSWKHKAIGFGLRFNKSQDRNVNFFRWESSCFSYEVKPIICCPFCGEKISTQEVKQI